MDIVQAVKDVGLGAVKILKFIENKTNGQSKGLVTQTLYLLSSACTPEKYMWMCHMTAVTCLCYALCMFCCLQVTLLWLICNEYCYN